MKPDLYIVGCDVTSNEPQCAEGQICKNNICETGLHIYPYIYSFRIKDVNIDYNTILDGNVDNRQFSTFTLHILLYKLYHI